MINIIGIGYKECSHFLRNIGFTGFAILDKHVISMLNLLGCNVQKPRNKKEYKEVEQKMIDFAKYIELNIDHLDLVFWSYKTGEIIK
jgi:N-glycosylase/DNA lyase